MQFARVVTPYSNWAAALTGVMKWASWSNLAMISASDVLFSQSESLFNSLNITVSIRFDTGTFNPTHLSRLHSSLARVIAVQARPADALAVALVARDQGLVSVGYAWLWLESTELFEMNAAESLRHGSSDALQTAGQTEEGLRALQGWLFISPIDHVRQSFLERVRAVATRGTRRRQPPVASLGNQSVESVQEGWSAAPGAHILDHVDLHAARLYDSIMLYARTARQVLRANESLGNGPAVVAAMKNISFQGASGFVRLDAYRDRLDALQTVNMVMTAAGALERLPIGTFDTALQQYTPEAGRAVVWPGGTTTRPIDTLQLCAAGAYTLDGVSCRRCPAGAQSVGGKATACSLCAPGAAPVCFASLCGRLLHQAVLSRTQPLIVEAVLLMRMS